MAPCEMILRDLPPPPPGQEKWRFVSVAAGQKHFCFVTAEGHIVLVGNNKQGQIGLPVSNSPLDVIGAGTGPSAWDKQKADGLPHHAVKGAGGGGASASSSAGSFSSELDPIFYDLQFQNPSEEAPNVAVCGSNYTICYRRSSRRAVAIGNNLYGQLALGHKHILDNSRGFAEWPNNDSASESSTKSSIVSRPTSWLDGLACGVGIRRVVCGHNHTFLLTDDDRVLACGSNTWGELGLGSGQMTASPTEPAEVIYFRDHKIHVKNIAAGNCMSVFLTHEGRVYACGSDLVKQLPFRAQTPQCFPLCRDGTESVIRVRVIGCGADFFAFSNGKELFLRGAIPEFGVNSFTRRVKTVLLPDANDLMAAPSSDSSKGDGESIRRRGAEIVHIACAGSWGVAVSRDGGICGFGANIEGQIEPPVKAATRRQALFDQLKEECASGGGDKEKILRTGFLPDMLRQSSTAPFGAAATPGRSEVSPALFLDHAATILKAPRVTITPHDANNNTPTASDNGNVEAATAESLVERWSRVLAVSMGGAVLLDDDERYVLPPHSSSGAFYLPPLIEAQRRNRMKF